MSLMRFRFHSTPVMSTDPENSTSYTALVVTTGDEKEVDLRAPVRHTNGTSLSFGGLDVVLVPGGRRHKAALHMIELWFVWRRFGTARSAAKP